jgi:hypothetical protein
MVDSSHFSTQLPSSGKTRKYAMMTHCTLGEFLCVLICSFLLCLSWLLHCRVRKSRRDLWITLYINDSFRSWEGVGLCLCVLWSSLVLQQQLCGPALPFRPSCSACAFSDSPRITVRKMNNLTSSKFTVFLHVICSSEPVHCVLVVWMGMAVHLSCK